MGTDDQVFRQFVQTHGAEILRICIVYLKDYHLAEDMVQETFYRVYCRYARTKNNAILPRPYVVKTAMQRHLKQFTLEDDTVDTILLCAKKRYQHRRWVCRNLAMILPAILLLTGITAIGVPAYEQWRISVNQEQIPDLNPMKVIPISPSVQNSQNINQVFSSMEELEQYLCVHFLSSPMAQDNGTQRIRYVGPTWNEIHIASYITGDAAFVAYKDSDANLYTWVEGSLYRKPVDLTISFTSSPEQGDVGMEYLGAYSLLEHYVSAQGYPVNIIQEESAYESYIAVFVADGMKYELRAMTTLDEVKRIVDSFAY